MEGKKLLSEIYDPLYDILSIYFLSIRNYLVRSIVQLVFDKKWKWFIHVTSMATDNIYS